MRIITRLLAVLIFVGCSDGSGGSGPEPEVPTNVIIVSASIVPSIKTQTGNSGSWSDEKVTVSLRNTGGVGSAIIRLWGLPTSPNGPATLLSETQFDVPRGWERTLVSEFYTGLDGTSKTKRIEILSRSFGDVSFRQTAEYR